MAKWKKRCVEFKDVRELIDNGDCTGIMKALLEICRKYAKEDDDYADDFESLAFDIWETGIEDGVECEEDTADFYLDDFYDLCDAARIWLD